MAEEGSEPCATRWRRALRQRGARVAEAEPGALATVAINGYLEAKERSRL